MIADPKTQDQHETSRVLLDVMQKLLAELHPHESRAFRLTLDSSFSTDLRLDSLARVELISRLEQYFNITLPQRVFVDAETPRDLLRAIISTRGRKAAPVPAAVSVLPHSESESLPHEATTLLEVLEWHVKRHPEQLHIRILGEQGEEHTLSYGQLWYGAQQLATGLQQQGVQPGEAVAIMLPSGRDYFFSFYAILLSGAIPVPIYPPVRRSQLEEHLRRHSGILNNCAAALLITIPAAKLVARLLKSQVTSLREVVTVSDLAATSGSYSAPAVGPYQIAFLQYTSGSTGNPKGVVLTHANLLANIRVMGEAVKATSRDVFISWLPLYHDMGLIGAWLGSLYFSLPLVVMSPLSFLTHPQRWLWAIHQYRGTLSAAPNFGYELCLKRIRDEDLRGLDLSSWRVAFNGAEPVSPDTIERFAHRFRAAGLRPEIIMPVYGLAESSVGLAFPPLNRKPLIDCVQRDAFSRTGHAIPAAGDDKNALCFVASGQPLSGHQVRIIDSDGRELPERQQGALQFRGPSVTTGYFRNPQATKQLFVDDWLDSGDLAYIAQGDIFITGRSKDVIIRAGRNIYPHELEEAIGNIPGVRKGCVVAFGSTERHSGTERLVILVETREQETVQQEALRNKIIPIAGELIGMPPDEVLLVPPHTVLKTSSGKIRRSACRELYEHGQISRAGKSIGLQLLSMLLHSLLPEWRRQQKRLLNSLYAGYAWCLFGSIGCISWLCVMLLPRLGWRWSLLHGLSRLMAMASGTRLTVNGLQNLPPADQPCVYVANHSSYLDSYAISAAIPRAFAFVAKVELGKNVLLRLVLQRLGTVFVTHFDQSAGAIDAGELTRLVQQNRTLVFFPEGTFTRMPGLTDFYMGAFVTAVRANVPVVPIAIRGTRSILRANSWFPRHGHIEISIGRPISKVNLSGPERVDEWSLALGLRDAAREHILRYCGEPALWQHTVPEATRPATKEAG